MTKIHSDLTDLLASARSAIRAIGSMVLQSTSPRDQRPAMALVPVPVRGRLCQVRSASYDRGFTAIPGTNANAAVRMHADPVIEAWRSLDFDKTKTGNTGHFQPSRFAT